MGTRPNRTRPQLLPQSQPLPFPGAQAHLTTGQVAVTEEQENRASVSADAQLACAQDEEQGNRATQRGESLVCAAAKKMQHHEHAVRKHTANASDPELRTQWRAGHFLAISLL